MKLLSDKHTRIMEYLLHHPHPEYKHLPSGRHYRDSKCKTNCKLSFISSVYNATWQKNKRVNYYVVYRLRHSVLCIIYHDFMFLGYDNYLVFFFFLIFTFFLTPQGMYNI